MLVLTNNDNNVNENENDIVIGILCSYICKVHRVKVTVDVANLTLFYVHKNMRFNKYGTMLVNEMLIQLSSIGITSYEFGTLKKINKSIFGNRMIDKPFAISNRVEISREYMDKLDYVMSYHSALVLNDNTTLQKLFKHSINTSRNIEDYVTDDYNFIIPNEFVKTLLIYDSGEKSNSLSFSSSSSVSYDNPIGYISYIVNNSKAIICCSYSTILSEPELSRFILEYEDDIIAIIYHEISKLNGEYEQLNIYSDLFHSLDEGETIKYYPYHIIDELLVDEK